VKGKNYAIGKTKTDRPDQAARRYPESYGQADPPARRRDGAAKKIRGKYDRDECVGRYIRYLQTLVEIKAIVSEGGQAMASERAERLRFLSAGADLREIELARERARLVSIEDVDAEMNNLISVTKSRVLAVGARVAPDLVGENSRVMIQAVIETAHKETLSQLAKL
jgi:hypothetical protein